MSRRPRNPTQPTEISALLSQSGDHVLQRARWLQQMSGRLVAHLDAHLATHVRLGDIRDGQLIFLADSPLWHNKLRLHAPRLLENAQQLGLDAQRVTIKVAAPSTPVNQRSPAPKPWSDDVKRALALALAACAPADGSGGDVAETKSDNPTDLN